MFRKALEYLSSWKNRTNRKPLIIRGARQTGKSTLVRMFAEKNGLRLLESNFEERPEVGDIFRDNRVDRILLELEVLFGQRIGSGCLLFLDEVQAVPHVLQVLRYFYEKKPYIPVIAAGSLLDFVLEGPEFSVPVGRVEYMFLGPMDFEEYLLATGREAVRDYLGNQNLSDVPESLHLEAMNLFREWCLVGGMPEVVKIWAEEKSFLEVDRIKAGIINTMKDDFNKYRKRVNVGRLQRVFEKYPAMVGRKIVLSKLEPDGKSGNIRQSLDLLEAARVIYPVTNTDANGIPLGAQKKPKQMKGLFLDVGILNYLYGLHLNDIVSPDDLFLINSGVVAEQAVGQLLLYKEDYYNLPTLYYWTREKPQSSAELDFVVSLGREVIPVEVKSGPTGKLRSLHSFMRLKKSTHALRFYAGPPAEETVNTQFAGERLNYRLLSLPLYLAQWWENPWRAFRAKR